MQAGGNAGCWLRPACCHPCCALVSIWASVPSLSNNKLRYSSMDTGSEQRALQSRLDQVFGQLSRGQEQPSWQPTTQPVFRVGAPITDQGDSSDEEDEYKERARREVVPGAPSLRRSLHLERKALNANIRRLGGAYKECMWCCQPALHCLHCRRPVAPGPFWTLWTPLC